MAFGRLPEVGLVCLRHRRWLGSPLQPHVPLQDVLSAERAFRAILVRRGELFDSPVMNLARSIAVASVGLEGALEPSAPRALPAEAFIYPIQV